MSLASTSGVVGSTPLDSGVMRATSRAHYADTSSHLQWNFLRGEGPSSSEMYYAPEKQSWKPGWNSRRVDIQQDKERIANTRAKEQRQTAIKEIKAEMVNQCQDPGGINPITGLTRRGALAVDPPSYRAHVRPAATILQTTATNRAPERAENLSQVYEMRKARIGNDGLTGTRRTGGTTASCLNWQS